MSHCRSCNAEIIWAETIDGNWMPIDSKPAEDGILVLLNGKIRLAKPSDRALHRPLYLSHFATCPHASKWRRES